MPMISWILEIKITRLYIIYICILFFPKYLFIDISYHSSVCQLLNNSRNAKQWFQLQTRHVFDKATSQHMSTKLVYSMTMTS